MSLNTICAAPTVLAELGLLEGRRATCYPGMEPEMCGAVMQNAGVVRDGTRMYRRRVGCESNCSAYGGVVEK